MPEEMQIDWSKAPAGATHYCAESEDYMASWFKQDGSEWMFCLANHKIRWTLFCDEFPGQMKLIERQAAWNGSGLPPVGTVCEYDASAYNDPPLWHVVEVVYASEWLVVVRCLKAPCGREEGVGVEHAVDATEEAKAWFRHLRTPEQIAAEEREKAIQEMFGFTQTAPTLDIINAQRMACADLYDAGYRLAKGEA